MSGYLDRLEKALVTGGFNGEFMIARSNGDGIAVEMACSLPVSTALRGRAAGGDGGVVFWPLRGVRECDYRGHGRMSSDVSLSASGRSELSPQTSIDFRRGDALHAGALLDEVGIARAIVPRYLGVSRAMGCVIADMRQDFVQTIYTLVSTLDQVALGGFTKSHLAQGKAMLDKSRTTLRREIRFELDMVCIG